MQNHSISLTSMQGIWPERAVYRHLPPELTPLIGREREVVMLCDLLTHPEVRLLTLLGPGGVGKTRLGLHVALRMQQHFSDGVLFVPLAMIRDHVLLVPTIAQALRLQESRGYSLLEQVQSALQDQHILLLLDNFEHVVQTAPLLEDLLLTCPFLKILVTSRDVLHLRAEQQFPVAPFPLPEHGPRTGVEDLAQNPAVALFLERARAIVPTFQLISANARAVADICISLDGLPLALELAAARVKTLPPQALLARLSQRLTLLTGGARTLPQRQQTLRNTLQWSYDLLSPQEQWLFRLLSVFVGGCTLEAVESVAEALTGKSGSLLDLVTALMDKSLIVPVGEVREEPRFVMLETVREYGLEALRDRGESEVCHQAHATYYLRLSEEAETHFKGGGQQIAWLKQLTQEQANLRAALSWLLERREALALLKLSGVLWWYWNLRGSSSEALEWLQTALELPGAEEPTAARARALCGAGFLTVYLHSPRREGLALLEESLATASHLGEQVTMAETCGWYAQAQIYMKDYHSARSLAERGIALSHAVGERRFVAFNQSMLALVVEKQEEEAEAVAQWERSLAMALELDEHVALATRARRHLAALALARGDYASATALLEENLALSREAGNPTARSWALAGLAELTRLQGDHVWARALCTEGLALSHDTGDRYATSRLLSIQGNIAQAQGEHEQAIASYRDSLLLAATLDASDIAGHCLLGLAQEALATGDFRQATRLFAAATCRFTINRQLAPAEQAVYERNLSDLRAHLDAATFSAAWAEGETMTPQQALALLDLRHQEQELSPRTHPVAAELAPGSRQLRASRYPDKLTAREVDVLRLVAQGWTDSQIAEELVISTRTVNAHLTSIYRKIRVSSRHAATHYALTQHLV
jgi:predicted ATPase/DNA-binding CsgD family transcriptional regulator